MMTKPTWTLLTPPNSGAIAIVQLTGNVSSLLEQLTNQSNWTDQAIELVTIEEIDESIAVQLHPQLAYLMPHGGIHILRKLGERFDALGIERSDNPEFPEANDAIEAAMLHTLSLAQSPLAARLLLQQPPKLRGAKPSKDDFNRSAILNHLIIPPKVVLLGSPNTGKSTLMNALTKLDTSIVHDFPGATRDAVGARINCGGLVIDLYDLPGFRDSEDSIEQEAIKLAQTIVDESTLTILIADYETNWIKSTQDCIRVATKSDIKHRDDADLCVSSHTGENMQELSFVIRDAIIPPNVLSSEEPWFFLGYNPTDE